MELKSKSSTHLDIHRKSSLSRSKDHQNRILVLVNRPQEYKNEFSKFEFPDSEIIFADGRLALKAGELSEAYIDANSKDRFYTDQYNIILGSPEYIKPFYNEFPKVDWIQSTHAGIDGFLKIPKEFFKTRILTGVKGIFGSLMGEYVIGQLIGFERGSLAQWDNQKQGKWKRWVPGSISGKTMMILGTGSIAVGIARMVKAFGIEVLGVNSNGRKTDGFDKCFRLSQIEESETNLQLTDHSGTGVDIREQVDYLVNTLPLTEKTRGLINSSLLTNFSEKTILVNVGRGEAVNEQDLIELLNQQKIRGAILDVFNTEPLSSSSDLWSTKNLIVSPHNGAITPPSALVTLFRDNYQRYLNGNSLNYVVDFDKGY